MRTRTPIALAMVATLLLTAPVAAQIPGLNRARDAIGGRLPSLSSFLEGDPPITTSLDDARTEIAFLDDWSPIGWERLDGLPRTQQGAFRLRPGLFALEAQSYCMHAGTHGPGGGDGYLYAPLAGPKAPIVQSILRNSVAHPEVEQRDIQVLIWAIIARTEFDEMPRQTQQTARALLSRDEIRDLSKGALGLVPESVMREAMSRLPPVARQVFQAEAELRARLSRGVSSFEELERIAVLAGDPLADPDSRPVPEERWSFDPDGYFVRYHPSGYSRTRVEVSVPKPVAIARNASGRIAGVYGSYGQRLEMTGGGLRLVGPGGGTGEIILGTTPSPAGAGGGAAAAVLAAVLGSGGAPAGALRDLAEIEGLARAVRAGGTAVGDGVSAPGGAASVRSSRPEALDLLVEAWQATFCQAAGCPSTPAGEDVLVLRSGEVIRGELQWCFAGTCALATTFFPTDGIAWIGLARADATPPAVQHPDAGEVHLESGTVEVGNLLSLSDQLVLTDGGGHDRPDVAWVHLVAGEEEEDAAQPPSVGGAPDGGPPPAAGDEEEDEDQDGDEDEDGGGGEFDGPVYDPSDDVATPGNRGRQRLAQSGQSSGDGGDPAPEGEEDPCAGEMRNVSQALAQYNLHVKHIQLLYEQIQEIQAAVGQGSAEWRRLVDEYDEAKVNLETFKLNVEEAKRILQECLDREGAGRRVAERESPLRTAAR